MVPLRHLLWKDYRIVQTLLLLILTGALLMQSFVTLGTSEQWLDRAGFQLAAWWMFPLLFALAVPALLVGTEEEHGTLNFLRVQPVRWQSIASSKLLVASGSLCLIWVWSSLLFWVLADDHTKFANSSEENVAAIGFAILFSAGLLASGFVTAYLLRSPLAALLATLPTIWLAGYSYARVAALLEHSYDSTISEQGRLLILACVWLVWLLILHLVSRLLAWRRLSRPLGKALYDFAPTGRIYAADDWQVVHHMRPRLISALLWQACRQSIGPASLIALLVIAGFVLDRGVDRAAPIKSGVGGIVALVWVLLLAAIVCAPAWLGVTAFIKDTRLGYRNFFSDRGIPAASLWWTRLLGPTAILLTFCCAVWLVQFPLTVHPDTAPYRQLPGFVVIGLAFSLGLIAGQWHRRPAMAYMVAAVFSFLAVFVTVACYALHPLLLLVPAISVGLTLFGSRHLMRSWLEDGDSFRFHGEAAGWCALALGLPVGAVLIMRLSLEFGL